jgi:large subunit ribosomal protein L25
MANAELNITPRDRAGKGIARQLRRQGLIPAVVYGQGITTTAISLDPKALTKAISTDAGLNTLITLRGEGVDGRVVIVKDLQFDFIRRVVTHADFHAINLQEKVHVLVPIHPVGKSVGEKEGGNLQIIRHELEVSCLPNAIPSFIEVDVTNLDIGDVLHVEDLVLPAGVTAPHDVNFTVITVTGHREEAGAEGEETPAAV